MSVFLKPHSLISGALPVEPTDGLAHSLLIDRCQQTCGKAGGLGGWSGKNELFDFSWMISLALPAR